MSAAQTARRLLHPGVELATQARIALQAKVQSRDRDGAIGASLVPKRVRINDLIKSIETDYSQRGRKSWRDCECGWRLHVKPYFGDVEVDTVTTDLLNDYVARRQKEKTKDGRVTTNATIARELALLKRMMRLGARTSAALMRHIPQFSEVVGVTTSPRLHHAKTIRPVTGVCSRFMVEIAAGRVFLFRVAQKRIAETAHLAC